MNTGDKGWEQGSDREGTCLFNLRGYMYQWMSGTGSDE